MSKYYYRRIFMAKISEVILLFFIYSVIGWLWETIYCSLKAKKFVYRGFLIGPYCPVYGFGVLLVLYFIEPYQNNLAFLYLYSSLLVTILEYLTSYILEKLFHASWWDYTDVPLNINGRVALPISLFWGFGCVLIIEVIQPKVLLFEHFLFQTFTFYLPILLLLLLAADLLKTVTEMKSFQKISQEWTQLIETTKNDLQKQAQELSTKTANLKTDAET